MQLIPPEKGWGEIRARRDDDECVRVILTTKTPRNKKERKEKEHAWSAHTLTSRRAVSKCSNADKTPPELKPPSPPSKALSQPVVLPEEEDDDDEDKDDEAEAADASHSARGVPPPPPLLRRAFTALPFFLWPATDDGDDCESGDCDGGMGDDL
jgi:hypothetical protein